MEKKLDKKHVMELVKKAYLGAAREDEIKNNLAYYDITFSWNIQDIDFWFTVELSGGKLFVKEGKAKDPDIIFYNDKLDQFHRGNTEEMTGRDMKDEGSFRWTGNARYMRHISVLCRHMREHYKELAVGR